MRRSIVISIGILLFIVACSREEKKSAPATSSAPAPTTTTQTAAPAPATPVKEISYASAMEWFKSAKGFHFTFEESGVKAEGDLSRATIGAERVRFRSGDADWLGISRASGVAWYRLAGGKWKLDERPADITDRVWQRTTIAFDPSKKEGEAKAAGTETNDGRGCTQYQFTNANNGDAHTVCVDALDGYIASIRIDSKYTPALLKITRADEAVNIEDPGK